MMSRRARAGAAPKPCVLSFLFAFLLQTTATASKAAREADEWIPPVDEPAQRIVHWNARAALRAEEPREALRLWLLKNALSQAGEGPDAEEDFRSAVWVAIGDLGLCPDGLALDEKGAGLWPLATYNWALRRAAASGDDEEIDAWEAFAGGMQQRPISLHDVLSLEELKSVRFARTGCFGEWWAIARTQNALVLPDLNDRGFLARLLYGLVLRAQRTLREEGIEGRAVLTTRLFDLRLAMVKLAAAKSQQETGLFDELLAGAGVSGEGRQARRRERLARFRASNDAELWRVARSWPALEWMSLSQQRRLALFGDMDGEGGDVTLQPLVLDVIDRLIEDKKGAELEQWLGLAQKEAHRGFLNEAVTEGERGERILSLSVEQGFRERAAIALHRGVAALQRGEVMPALRAFAFSLAHAEESSRAEEVHRLALRWLSFVLSEFETSEEVMVVLEEFVPDADRRGIWERLLWRAALRVDTNSFERVRLRIKGRGSLARTASLLAPLANGQPAAVFALLEEEGQAEGTRHGLVRFLAAYLDHLSLEPLHVRVEHTPMLRRVLDELEAYSLGGQRSVVRKAERLSARAQALLDVSGAYDESLRGNVKYSLPEREAYAGSVRLSPTDELPWPFRFPKVTAPSPFTRIALTPVEWRRADGTLVYGWRIHE
ncbi:MAG: hypothetical protein ACO3JL_04585 [Myxococcota bacterium]